MADERYARPALPSELPRDTEVDEVIVLRSIPPTVFRIQTLHFPKWIDDEPPSW